MTHRDEINRLVEAELKEANKKYPLFSSQHEAYAVLKEEVEEMVEEAEKCKEHLQDIWRSTRNDFECDYSIKNLRGRALYTVQEGIQVIAMCDKAMTSLEKKRESR